MLINFCKVLLEKHNFITTFLGEDHIEQTVQAFTQELYKRSLTPLDP